MKTYRIRYESSLAFSRRLGEIRKECSGTADTSFLFYMTWTEESKDNIPIIESEIMQCFPGASYFGNEASGNILDGRLAYGSTVTCYVFEDPDTSYSLLWVEKGTELGSLKDLWKYCKAQKGLRAVELIPSISYLDTLAMDGDVPTLPDDIVIFGGASVNYDNPAFVADIVATSHPMTKEGMAVVLYFGKNLHVSDTYVLGWKGLGRYMKVTKSHGKIISEIEGVPAHELYEKYLNLTDEDNDNLVFPLIVEEDGYEFIRTPQAFLPDKSMRMFATIAEGSMTRISYGDKNTILNSLYQKYGEIAAFDPQAIKAYSCAARRLFWGDNDVHRETLPLQDIAPICGFYTGGEILRFGRKLRVLNSTLALVSFREGDAMVRPNRNAMSFDKKDKSLLARITHFVGKISEEQEAALKVANEEKHRNDIIHEILHSGKWSYGIDASDRVTSASYSNLFLQIANQGEDPMGWVKFLHPEDRRPVLDAFEKAIADHTCNTPYDCLFRILNRQGKYIWQRSAGRVVRHEDGTAEMYGLTLDITSQIETQEKQRKQLEDALTMAQSANRAKTAFLNNMSHDIRTPMNAIIGFSGLALSHIDQKDKVRDYLLKIGQSSNHLLSLINDVLDMSRIESGKVNIEEKDENLSDIIRSLKDIVQSDVSTKELDFTIDTTDVKHYDIICDRLRLSQVLLNILSNAIKFTAPHGRVSMRVTETETALSGYSSFCFVIRDNGIGMKPEFLKTIFDPFTRAKSSTVSGVQGTGLGMAITKNILDMMGGKIAIKSEPNVGTEMTVTCNIRLQHVCIDEIDAAKSAGDGGSPLKDKKILIVEDNELNLEIASVILEEFGCRVVSAPDGDVAVEMFRKASAGDFDLVLMDIQMPNMNGYEATRRIRRMNSPLSRIPIIAMTANAFEEDRRAALESGMNEHVAKPIDTAKLREVLERFLK